MSFREVRSFTEKMRALGYPSLISMESFRAPNFDMVASILLWLVKSYDPSIDISEDVSTEQDRIVFIKSIASFMAPKAHIKLNTRKLYMADGNAVRELLKIAQVLYDARLIKTDEAEETTHIPPLDISGKIGQLRTCRTLASEITEHGAKLYDLLGKEMELKDIRASVISRPFELKTMEATVTAAIAQLSTQIHQTRASHDNLTADESNLLSKIEKKKVELDRARKRLASLQSVRPAYMDEYERIECDLAKLYDTYMSRFRNLTYLEQQLDEYNRQEQHKFDETEESLKRMQNRLREEEMRLLRGDKEMRSMMAGGVFGGETASARLNRPKAAGQRSRSYRNLSESGSDNERRGHQNDNVDEDDMDDDLSISATDLMANADSALLGEEVDFAQGIRDEGGSRSRSSGSDNDNQGDEMDDDEDDDDLELDGRRMDSEMLDMDGDSRDEMDDMEGEFGKEADDGSDDNDF